MIIEEQRFLVWGSIQQLIVDGCDALDRPKNWNANNLLRNPAIEKAVRETLLAIKLNSETLYPIFKKYGFYKLDKATSLGPKITTEPGAISAALNRRMKNRSFRQWVNRRKSSGDSLRRRISWGKRVGFVLDDKEKIDKCLLDFAHFNKSLCSFTMSVHQASLAQVAIVTQLTQSYIPRTPHARIDALRFYREAARSNPHLAIYIEAQHKASELEIELENENRSVYRSMVSGARVQQHIQG